MEHVNGWCFRGIYKGGLWEDDLHVSVPEVIWVRGMFELAVWKGIKMFMSV